MADDVTGGFFALNGGAFSGQVGEVFYLAPDTLFGDISKFYESFRWNGWMKEIHNIDGNQGVLIYPFLWADGEELEKRSRSFVRIEELWDLNIKYRDEFGVKC